MREQLMRSFVIATAATILILRLCSLVGAETRQEQPGSATIPNESTICSEVRPGSHEHYHLPANKKLPEGVSFATDWTQIRSGGWFGEQVMDNCRIHLDGFRTWHGKVAVRVEVQPNDDPLNLKANSERAEMMTMQSSDQAPIKENSGSGIIYYATSYYFPKMWLGQQLRWSSFAPTDCSVGNQNQCNSWSFVWQFYGWGAMSAAQTTMNGPQRYRFNDSEFTDGGLLNLGKWTDFVFMVNWRTGDYKVWRRDEGLTYFNEALKGNRPVQRGEVYVKQGLYRGGNVSGRTDVLWIGPTVRGSSFQAVERQAFGTNSGISGN